MFKRVAVRLVAGMLFGASAGVLWGVWFQAAQAGAFGPKEEIVQMNSLLSAIMIGSVAGFVVGSVIGLARNSVVTGVVAGILSVIVIFLPPGFPFGAAKDVIPALEKSSLLLSILCVIAAVMIPKRSSV